MPRRLFLLLVLVLVLAPPGAAAQDTALPLRTVVERALTGYPTVAAAEADRQAAAAAIDIAPQANRPRVDGLVQLNRATHQNVAGLLLPQSVIAPISGPVSSPGSEGSVWGTSVGALVTWKPFDFGSRQAGIAAAEGATEQSRLALERVRLDTASTVADAYLSALAAEAAVTAAQAAVDRAGVLSRSVDALVGSGLRPGVDGSSARAEHAAAVMFAIEARRAADAARALVSQYAGTPVRTRPLPPAPADQPAAAEAALAHPALLERDAAIREATQRLTMARRSADPEVALQGTVYGRGTGVLDDNTSGSGVDGFGLDEGNWAAGVTITVPMMEWANRKAREAAQAARLKAAEARREETSRDLARRQAVAAQAVTAARAIAQQVPLVVEAARSAHAQATARYQAGLSSLTDVADAQRRLAQAELDAALADLTVWRARLHAAALAADSADTFLRALPVVP